MKDQYEHLLAVDEYRGIGANIVYQKVGYNFIGTYYGYEGGGCYSDGFFWINDDEGVLCDWDTSEFPEEFRTALEKLAEIRHGFESDEEDEEGAPSQKGLELRQSKNTNEHEHHWEYWSDNCDLFVIALLSSQWGLSMHWEED